MKTWGTTSEGRSVAAPCQMRAHRSRMWSRRTWKDKPGENNREEVVGVCVRARSGSLRFAPSKFRKAGGKEEEKGLLYVSFAEQLTPHTFSHIPSSPASPPSISHLQLIAIHHRVRPSPLQKPRGESMRAANLVALLPHQTVPPLQLPPQAVITLPQKTGQRRSNSTPQQLPHPYQSLLLLHCPPPGVALLTTTLCCCHVMAVYSFYS